MVVYILRNPKLALLCSSRCPGDPILKTYDLARSLRDAGVTVIGGFHSPMEQECLGLLLRGKQPVIVCPARNLECIRLRAEWKKPLDEGRLLLLSPFDQRSRRMTAETAKTRNRFVAALADRICIAYAEPGGKIDSLVREILPWGKPVFTLDGESNSELISLGVTPISIHDLTPLLAGLGEPRVRGNSNQSGKDETVSGHYFSDLQ